jgi:hypothetical protein
MSSFSIVETSRAKILIDNTIYFRRADGLSIAKNYLYGKGVELGSNLFGININIKYCYNILTANF